MDRALADVTALYDWMDGHVNERNPYIRVKDSVRAGVHVHINQRDRTLLETVNFAFLFWILEEAMVDALCGEERAGNMFCLRLVDAEYPIMELENSLRNLNGGGRRGNGRWGGVGDSSNLRYAGLNLTSLGKYGTLEFRTLRTPQAAQPILDWMRALNAVRTTAMGYENPQEILNAISGGGATQLLQQIFADEPNILAQLNTPDIESKVFRGVRLVQSFAYNTNWSTTNGNR
jgi:hypothetical protein